MPRLLLLLPLALLGATPAVAQEVAPAAPPACPCGGYGPYPCAPATLAALPDQAAALGLTRAQADSLRALQQIHLTEIHDEMGEIRALTEAFHRLERPLDLAETFALFYDLGGHYAEMDDTFRSAEASLLGVLTADQRARWAALIAEAAAYQEAPPAEPGCEAAPGR